MRGNQGSLRAAKRFLGIRGGSEQQYPLDSFGIQNIFKEFPTNNAVTENGKVLYFPKGGRGFEGEPGVPPSSEGVGGFP